LPASLGGTVDESGLTALPAPVNSPQLVRRVLTALRSLGKSAPAVAPAAVAAPTPQAQTPKPAPEPQAPEPQTFEPQTPAQTSQPVAAVFEPQAFASKPEAPMPELPTSPVETATSITAGGEVVASITPYDESFASMIDETELSEGARNRESSAPIVRAALAPDPSLPEPPRLSARLKANRPAEEQQPPSLAKKTRRRRR